MGDPWKFKKSQVEQYQFNGPDGLWAIITLDPRGIFQAISDFGSYAYEGWGCHGRASFKHFLVGLTEADYFITKVCGNGQGRSGPGECGRVFDFDRSVQEIKRDICRMRHQTSLDADVARQCWDELKELGDTEDSTYFVWSVQECCPTLFEYVFRSDPCELAEDCRRVLAAGPLRFFEEIFRGQLVPALRAEIAAEQPVADKEAL